MLVLASRNRQLLSCDDVSACTGMFSGGLGDCLEPIQSYCLCRKSIPRSRCWLSARRLGLPGTGFSAINIQTPEDFAAKLQEIFSFDWSRKAPEAPTLAKAVVKKFPSNGF